MESTSRHALYRRGVLASERLTALYASRPSQQRPSSSSARIAETGGKRLPRFGIALKF